jgi:hypothetical protein
MTVFRQAARRRSVRPRVRRRTSTRWAPPGYSPAAGVTLDLATFHDTFAETTLKPWWQDGTDLFADPTADPVVTAGAGAVFTPATGQHTEIYGRYPFTLASKSVTFDLSIPASTFTQTNSFIEIALLVYPLTGVRAMGFALAHTGTVWEVTITLDNSIVTQTYTTTTGAEWRLIKVTSSITNPAAVTVYRSPDGYVWTQVATRTFASEAGISSLIFYAWGNGA